MGASYKLAPEEINIAKGVSRTSSVSHTGKNFGKVYIPKSDTSELSKESGKVRKRVE
ncbi:hypothetical protein HMPREF9072_01567 [Capnocytophaga sp. oral taxon 324 str. F0483]|nr:hypothetical protein HMPREF9072_01567 [Capnocytophaga sp. oral taxon 324 str. F0483]